MAAAPARATPPAAADRAGPSWHALAAEAALERLGVSPERGLDPREAARRLEAHGPNALAERAGRPALAIFLGQLKSPLIYLLFVAAAAAFALGERADAVVILAVVLLNSVVGALQEGRAQRSMAALRRLSALEVKVIRGGHEQTVPARALVPGDIVALAAGDAVGADGRLVEVAALQIAEAALTGESLPVSKDPAALPADTPLADRRSMIYSGTQVTAGRGRAVVVATGAGSEVGRIAALTESAEEPATPLERRIAQFGRALVVCALALFAIVLGVGLGRGLEVGEIFMVAVSQTVSLVPEGLPVAMTIALAVGMQRMAARRAIVRRLAAVETLGSTTVICTDKTGTLTRNEMTVTAVFLGGGRDEVEATGAGFAPDGRLLEGGREVRAADDPALSALLEAAILCNDAALAPPEAPGDGGLRVVGDPMEAALLVVARKGGLEPDAVRARLPRRAEVPFDAAIKAMATGHEVPGKPFVVVKGAPEVVLDLCADAAAREDARAAVDRMAGRALRVLAFAVAEGVTLGAAGIEAVRGRAVFRGLVGLVDPPRPEARDAVLECRAAFVRTVMVTGDHRATGLAIARQIEIAREGDEAVDGRELEEMTDAALGQRLEKIAVFARVHPAQKLRIVEAFQAKDHVVAMTGDGVNDAPALARADVGVAMGRTGTEVAKEAAKIVLTDDNFATIVGAVEEGRVVYANLKKVILFLFATSLDEVLVLLSALVLGYPLPLAAVQILWINIVTEGTITVNLIMDPREGDEMRRPPISRGEPLVTRDMLGRMALMTLASATSTLLFFAWHLEQGVPFAQTQTAVFTLTAVCQWFNVLNCRSARQSALRLDILRNKWLVGGLLLGNLLHVAVVFSPPLNRLFHTAPLPWTEIFAIGAAGSVVLWVEETRKWLVRRRARVDAPSLHG